MRATERPTRLRSVRDAAALTAAEPPFHSRNLDDLRVCRSATLVVFSRLTWRIIQAAENVFIRVPVRRRSMTFRAVLTVSIALLVVALASERPIAQEPGRGGGRGRVQLPEGAGKDLVQMTCTKCHALQMISGYWGGTRDEW